MILVGGKVRQRLTEEFLLARLGVGKSRRKPRIRIQIIPMWYKGRHEATPRGRKMRKGSTSKTVERIRSRYPKNSACLPRAEALKPLIALAFLQIGR